MNRARSFGPALASGDLTSYWVYVAGQLAGALIAVGCAMVLRLPPAPMNSRTGNDWRPTLRLVRPGPG